MDVCFEVVLALVWVGLQVALRWWTVVAADLQEFVPQLEGNGDVEVGIPTKGLRVRGVTFRKGLDKVLGI